jgi:hypothetical protein
MKNKINLFITFVRVLRVMWLALRQHTAYVSTVNWHEDQLPYFRVYKPHFWQEFTLRNWGAAYTRNGMSFWPLSPRRRYCMLWNSQWRPIVFQTVILQAVIHTRMRQRITRVSVCHNQFPEVGRPWHHWQIAVNVASNNKSAANAIAIFFTFAQIKSSEACIRVIISKFLT